MKHSIKGLFSLAVFGQAFAVLADDTVECYAMDAINNTTATYNTLNLCAVLCREAGRSVFAAQGSDCSCLDILPPYDERADASQCNVACPGYAFENCGGQPGYYSVGAVPGLITDPSRASSSSASTTGIVTTTIVSNGTASVSASQTSSTSAVASSSNTSSIETVIATPSSSSGSSGSASPTVESNSAGAPVFIQGATFVASVVLAMDALVAII